MFGTIRMLSGLIKKPAATTFSMTANFLEEALNASIINLSAAVAQRQSVSFSAIIVPNSDDHSSHEITITNPSNNKTCALEFGNATTFNFTPPLEACESLFKHIAPHSKTLDKPYITEAELNEILLKAAWWKQKNNSSFEFSFAKGDLIKNQDYFQGYNLLMPTNLSGHSNLGLYNFWRSCGVVNLITNSENDKVVFYEKDHLEGDEKTQTVTGKSCLLVRIDKTQQIILLDQNSKNVQASLGGDLGFTISLASDQLEIIGNDQLLTKDLSRLTRLRLFGFAATNKGFNAKALADNKNLERSSSA